MSEKIISDEIVTFLKKAGFDNPALLGRISQATYSFVCEGSLSNQQHYTKASEFSHHYDWLKTICNGKAHSNMDLFMYINFDDDDLVFEFNMEFGIDLKVDGHYRGVMVTEFYDDLMYFHDDLQTILKDMTYELTESDYEKDRRLKRLSVKL